MSILFILLENSGCLSSLAAPIGIRGRNTLLTAFFPLLPKATAGGDKVPLTFMLWHAAPSQRGRVYYGEHMDVQGGKSAGWKPSIKWDWKRFLHRFWKLYDLFPQNALWAACRCLPLKCPRSILSSAVFHAPLRDLAAWSVVQDVHSVLQPALRAWFKWLHNDNLGQG